MPKSTYLSNKVINTVLTGVNFTSPISCYVGLFNGNPESGGVELSGGSYVRQQVIFTTASNGITSNSNLFTFSDMPAVELPQSIKYLAICDSSTGGNLLYVIPLASPRNTELGDTINGAAGTISIMES